MIFFAYVFREKINLITHELNSYHSNINFTYDNKLSLLDLCVAIIKKNKIETFVYRKATNSNIYMNWYSHVP